MPTGWSSISSSQLLLLLAFMVAAICAAPPKRVCKMPKKSLKCGCKNFLTSETDAKDSQKSEDDSEFFFVDDMAFRMSRLSRDEEEEGTSEVLNLAFWPGGIVFYLIEDSFSSDYRELILSAMKAIESSAPGHLEFREALTRKGMICRRNYVNIRPTASVQCASEVGMQLNKPTNMWLNERACPLGTVIHELLHALGRYHEQCRPDRDQFVEVVSSAISDTECRNFEMITRDLTDNDPTLRVGYDIKSIMHYGSCTFSCNGQYTIIKRGGGRLTANRKNLTELDIEKLRVMFPKSSKVEFSDLMCRSGSTQHPCDFCLIAASAILFTTVRLLP